jgi:uncharacterized membrane protein YeaQ/YmgE (transglycosylase-associated protein family)
MPAFSWLLIGSAVGFVATSIVGKAYGTLMDTLLGISGAFLAHCILRLPSVDIKTSWADKSLFMIWAAVAFLLLARFIAKRQAARGLPRVERKTSAPQSRVQAHPLHLERRAAGLSAHNNISGR